MRLLLRLTAAGLLLATAGWWAASGRNPGWTKNQVAVETLDDITGITGTTYEKRLVPGVDLLAAATALSLLLSASTFLRRRRTP